MVRVVHRTTNSVAIVDTTTDQVRVVYMIVQFHSSIMPMIILSPVAPAGCQCSRVSGQERICCMDRQHGRAAVTVYITLAIN